MYHGNNREIRQENYHRHRKPETEEMSGGARCCFGLLTLVAQVRLYLYVFLSVFLFVFLSSSNSLHRFAAVIVIHVAVIVIIFITIVIIIVIATMNTAMMTITLQVLLHGVVALTLYWVIQYRWQVVTFFLHIQ